MKEGKSFEGGKKGTMDTGSDFKHVGVGSVLDVVLFADMLNDRGI